MIDTIRQVGLPAPSASAWLIDLTGMGGPQFAILRLAEDEARQALVQHLTDIGTFGDVTEAERAISVASASSIGVVW